MLGELPERGRRDVCHHGGEKRLWQELPPRAGPHLQFWCRLHIYRKKMMMRKSVFISILVLISACHPAVFSGGMEQVLSDTLRNASCAYMTRDTSGALVVSWVEQDE